MTGKYKMALNTIKDVVVCNRQYIDKKQLDALEVAIECIKFKIAVETAQNEEENNEKQ